MASFRRHSVIRLKDTDAAGIIFFVNYFVLAHETYELFLEKIGYSLRRITEQESFSLPIVHAESDYHQMLRLEDKVTIVCNVERIGKTSFTLIYNYYLEKQGLAGSVKTVHACINNVTLDKMPIPEELRQALKKYEKVT